MLRVILGCGARKRDHPCEAWQLYQGPVFSRALEWCLSVTLLPQIYILSAKHGLIQSTTVIAPYNAKMGEPSQVCSVTSAARQAKALGLDTGKSLLVNTGKPYRAVLTLPQAVVLADYMDIPDTRFGYQMQWFSSHHGQLPTGIPL